MDDGLRSGIEQLRRELREKVLNEAADLGIEMARNWEAENPYNKADSEFSRGYDAGYNTAMCTLSHALRTLARKS